MWALQTMVEKLLLLRDIQELCCSVGGDQRGPSLLLFRRVPLSDGLRKRARVE